MADDTPTPPEDAPPSPPPPSRTEIRSVDSTPSDAGDDSLDDDELAEGSELVEEDEEPEEPIVNIPLAMAFVLGGVGFLLVFLLNLSRGMHILPAVGWACAAFVAVTIVGFIIDVLLTRYRTVIIQPVETIEEPEDADGDEDKDESAESTPTAANRATESDAVPPQPGPA